MVSALCNPITFRLKCLFCEVIRIPNKLVAMETFGKVALINCLKALIYYSRYLGPVAEQDAWPTSPGQRRTVMKCLFWRAYTTV